MKGSLFIRKKTLIATIAFTLVFFIVSILPAPFLFKDYFRENFLWFIALVFFWMFYLYKHSAHKKINIYMSIVGILICLFFIIFAYRETFLDCSVNFQRYIWYLGYFPQNFIPVFLLYSAISVGKYDEEPLDKKFHLLLFPAIALSALIITNDTHQLVFKFTGEEKSAVAGNYYENVFYWFCFAWQLGLYLAVVIIILRKSLKAEYAKYILIPLIPLALGTIYIIISLFGISNGAMDIWSYPKILSFTIIFTWEGLVLIRAIPVNDGYEVFFKQSEIKSIIVDEQLNVKYKSGDLQDYSLAVLEAAIKAPVILENERITAQKIAGGYVFHAEDLTVVNGLKRELEEQSDGLLEYNELLALEVELKKKNTIVDTKNDLYDYIILIIENQIKELRNILGALRPDDPTYLDVIHYAAVIIVYIKRMSNLIILSKENDYLSANDLKYSLVEASDYLNSYGIETALDFKLGGYISGKAVILAYEMLAHIIAAAMPDVTCLVVVVNPDLSLRVIVDDPAKEMPEQFYSRHIEGFVAETTLEKDDSTFIYNIIIREGEDYD